MNPVEQRLSALGIVLPDVPTPMANYVPAVRSGKSIAMLYRLNGEQTLDIVKGLR